uniref:Transmembrane protein n=1 Tax=Globodera pallida TaxID=36090 RepID=A0A183CMV5_GLOPA
MICNASLCYMVRHGASALFSSQIRRGLAAASTFSAKPKPLVEPVQHKTSLSSLDLQGAASQLLFAFRSGSRYELYDGAGLTHQRSNAIGTYGTGTLVHVGQGTKSTGRMKPQPVASAVRHCSTMAQQRRVPWADNYGFLLGYLNLMIALSAIVVVSIVALGIYVAQNMSEMQQRMSDLQHHMSKMQHVFEPKEKSNFKQGNFFTMFGTLTTKTIDGPRLPPSDFERKLYIEKLWRARAIDFMLAAGVTPLASAFLCNLCMIGAQLPLGRFRVPYYLLVGVGTVSMPTVVYKFGAVWNMRRVWTAKYGEKFPPPSADDGAK